MSRTPTGTLHPKHVIAIMRLLPNVRFDDLVCGVATVTTEVAPYPDMTSPKLIAQVGEFGEQAIALLVLHPIDQATDGDMRPDRDHHMDII
jgi:hypothetical protein